MRYKQTPMCEEMMFPFYDTERATYVLKDEYTTIYGWFVNPVIQEECRNLPEYGLKRSDIPVFMAAQHAIWKCDHISCRPISTIGLGAHLLRSIRVQKFIESFRDNDTALSLRFIGYKPRTPVGGLLVSVLSNVSYLNQSKVMHLLHHYNSYPHVSPGDHSPDSAWYMHLRWHKKRQHLYYCHIYGYHIWNGVYDIVEINGPPKELPRVDDRFVIPENVSIMSYSAGMRVRYEQKPGEICWHSDLLGLALALGDIFFNTDLWDLFRGG